jgi:hypothetical protein
VGLAAVVDLVLEEVEEDAVGALALEAMRSDQADLAAERVGSERGTDGDQATVDGGLLAAQVGDRRAGDLVGPGGGAEAAALERVDIVPVDVEQVVQGALQGWEEARAGRFEFAGLKAVANGSAPG